ncbi:hypothetical protein GOC35_15795 [Sinorhizobium meliloti]|nr:hypothetical protein [Sinorhizobium meliloti]
MSEHVRLYIVTDDPAKASLDVLGCFLSEVPSFIRIVTDAAEVSGIPSGSRCLGYWCAWNSRRLSDAQLAWEELRSFENRRLQGVSEAFFSRIDEWNTKRRQAESDRLASIVAEYAIHESQGGPPRENPQKQRWF